VKILVTGGAGFIGSNLIPELLRTGEHEISVLDNESSGRFADIADYPIDFTRGDLLDEDVLAQAVAGRDAIIHLAADARVIDSIADPRRNFETNVVGTFKLLEAARQAGTRRIVYASTAGAILGEAPAPIDETMVARPLSPYGASKLAAEGYLCAFGAAYGIRTLSLRFSNVFGPKSYRKGSVIAHFFKRLIADEPLIVYGDGSQVRDYLFVGDLVRGIAAAIGKAATGTYQLGSGRPTSLSELLAAMRQAIGPNVPMRIAYAPFRAGEVHTTWCDISLAREKLGFDPSTSLVEGLATTWAWFQKVDQETLSAPTCV